MYFLNKLFIILNMEKYDILIVEDHALTSFALKTSLSSQGFTGEIFEAINAKSAYEILDKNKIDLVVMDIGLDEIDGIQATKHIREKFPDIKIIILSSHCDKDEVQNCLRAGINGYCTKDIKPEKLCEVIKDILKGSMYFDSSVSKFVMESTNETSSNKQTSIKDCYNLTKSEKRVLILLASGNNNSQIAKKLKISVNTAKVHVCSILQKMNVEDRTQAAIKAIRENLIV